MTCSFYLTPVQLSQLEMIKILSERGCDSYRKVRDYAKMEHR
jgi:hypothetical protein